MPTRTRYSDDWVIGGSLSVAGSTPWRIRRPCTGAPGRDFPLDVGATAASGRRSPPEVLSAHRGELALPPRGPCGDIGDGTGERGQARGCAGTARPSWIRSWPKPAPSRAPRLRRNLRDG